ncbi:ABC transporter permease [Mucilaginibacter sabulilitoris]|uniref:ABC transporter permease n=1 Tax=Mucilaginibacter sabulilitoris TaxID=1173583 RepID=A0ABZ0TPK3_9SPHI|nr:ABC transporter permease [Mucilaginibacter sabulilitoris]WPU93664.1 ABC transporter permease [Mucilaginibacter sabulilitoris]
MKGFLLSFRSEFYKSRKTLSFWASVLLPFLICLFLFIGFYTNSEQLSRMEPIRLWFQFAGTILSIMGTLLLPIYAIFIAYAVNSIEHRADTWKSLFSLPISRWAVYTAKYAYAVFLIFLCLSLFMLFTIGFGNLLSVVKPQLRFDNYHMEKELAQIYFKLFLSSLGILSIQFLLSLLWADFLKPMGIGFVCTIAGVIAASKNWEYSYAFPYSQPAVAISTMIHRGNEAMKEIEIDVFTSDVMISLIISVIVFIGGYFIVLRKSVK